MVAQYLLDTNPVIDFFNGNLSEKGKQFLAAFEPSISVITHIELLSNKNIPKKEWEQLHDFIRLAVIYPLEHTIVEQTIILRQNYKLKTPDAVIAATALTYNLTLLSRNLHDFKNITGLTVLDPHTL